MSNRTYLTDAVVEIEDENADYTADEFSWEDQTAGYTIGSKLGFIADRLGAGLLMGSDEVTNAVMVNAHDYTHGRSSAYFNHDPDVWGVVHRYPRFWAAESVPLAFRVIDRRWSGLFAQRPAPAEVKRRFEADREVWQIKSAAMSSLNDIAMIPEYQRIIGQGPDVVPLIIDSLRSELDHWFWALISIVGEDHGAGAQTLREAADQWIAWFDGLSRIDG